MHFCSWLCFGSGFWFFSLFGWFFLNQSQITVSQQFFFSVKCGFFSRVAMSMTLAYLGFTTDICDSSSSVV